MRKTSIFLTVISMLFLTATTSTSCSDPYTEKYRFYEGKQIIFNNDLPYREKVQIIDGDNIVFHYYHRYDELMWVDEEYTEILVFQIDEDSSEFDAENDTLLRLNASTSKELPGLIITLVE